MNSGAASQRRPERMEPMLNPAIPTPALTVDSSFLIHSPTTKEANVSQIMRLNVVRQAPPERRNNKNTDQSRNVVENKQNTDILPPKSSEILCKMTRIVGHFATK
jgi:hypothetical protein